MAEFSIGTVYKGKELRLEFNNVGTPGRHPVHNVRVKIDVPNGVAYKSANIPFGTYDPDTHTWTIPVLQPFKTYVAHIIYEITNDCISRFVFNAHIDSRQACDDCLKDVCTTFYGYSCCDLSKCGFTIVTTQQIDSPCVEGPVEPQDPPTDPIEGELFIEIFHDCEAWWKYSDGWILQNIPTSPEPPDGTVSILTPIVSGNPIATHNNGVALPVNIEETVTDFATTVPTGHIIGQYTDEEGVLHDIKETITYIYNIIAGNQIAIFNDEKGSDVPLYETITTLVDTILGHKIAEYTNEAGVVTDLNETVTSYTNVALGGSKIGEYEDENGNPTDVLETTTDYSNVVIGGNKVGEYTNEAGVVQNVEETITSLVDNDNGTFSYFDEEGIETNILISKIMRLTFDINLSNNTFIPVPDLTVAVQAGESYVVDLAIHASAIGNGGLRITMDGTATFTSFAIGAHNSIPYYMTGLGQYVVLTDDFSSPKIYIFSGVITVNTGGTLGLQVAHSDTGGGITIISPGSYLKLTPAWN